VQDLRLRVSVHETVYKLRVEQLAVWRMPSIVTTQRLLNTEALTFVGLTAAKCYMTISDGGTASVVWKVSPKNWDLPHDLEP